MLTEWDEGLRDRTGEVGISTSGREDDAASYEGVVTATAADKLEGLPMATLHTEPYSLLEQNPTND